MAAYCIISVLFLSATTNTVSCFCHFVGLLTIKKTLCGFSKSFMMQVKGLVISKEIKSFGPLTSFGLFFSLLPLGRVWRWSSLHNQGCSPRQGWWLEQPLSGCLMCIKWDSWALLHTASIICWRNHTEVKYQLQLLCSQTSAPHQNSTVLLFHLGEALIKVWAFMSYCLLCCTS